MSILELLETARPLRPWEGAVAPMDAAINSRLAVHWKPEPELSAEEWLRQNLKITGNQSAGDGGMALDLRRNPQARAVCEFIDDPFAEELNIRKGSAGGISTTIIGLCVRMLKRDPGNILYLIGNAGEARKMSEVYWRPFLRQVFGPVADAPHQATLHFKIAGVEIILGSPTEDQLRGKQFKYLIEDESDTMEDELRGGAQNLDIAERERTKNFQGSKIIRLCCPLYAYDPKAPPDLAQPFSRIDRHYQRGDQREFRVTCPKCGIENPIQISHLDYAHCRDLAGDWDLDRVREETVWKCPSCSHPVRDTLAEKAPFLETGRHVPTAKAVSKRVWSMLVTDLAVLFGKAASWGFVASEILEHENRGPSAVAGVLRSHLAVPLQREAENSSRTMETLMRHCSHYDRGICPVIPWVVIMAADVQKDASYFPWGTAAFNHRGDMFLIDWGEAQDTDELETIRKRPVPVRAVAGAALEARFAGGEIPPVYVTHAGIDSGHRAKGDEVDPTITMVYQFCHKAGMMRSVVGGATSYRYRWIPMKGRGAGQQDCLIKTSTAQLSDSIRLPLLLFKDPEFKSELYHVQLAYDPTPGAPESDLQSRGRTLPRILFPRYVADVMLEDGQIGYGQFFAELQAERFGAIMQKPRNGGPSYEVRKWYVPSGMANNFGDVVKMLKVLYAALPKPAGHSAPVPGAVVAESAGPVVDGE